MRTSSGFALTRATTFRHRPAHADQLHVDLWWRGLNIALDAGTFSYHAPQPWDNGLAGAMVHNTVTVDGHEQMQRTGRFLWTAWANGQMRATCHSAGGHIGYWEGEQDSYTRLPDPVSHRRAVLRLGDDAWMVVDALVSGGAHHYRLHWLLADWPHDWDETQGLLQLQTSAGPYQVRVGIRDDTGAYSLVRAAELSTRGWHSPRYHQRAPALSLTLTASDRSIFFYTLFCPQSADVSATDAGFLLQTETICAGFEWGDLTNGALVRSARVSAPIVDSLEPCIFS